MTETILFAGSSGASTDGARDLDAIDAGLFARMLDAWVGRVHVHAATAPTDDPELAEFSVLSVLSQFRQGYAAGDWSELDRGTSLEESWLNFQLINGLPARCLINEDFADQPSGRISRKTILDAADLVSSLGRWMTSSASVCQAFVRLDRRAGHSILLIDLEPQTGRFSFFDPWPHRSLLCAENNTVGIAASPDPRHPGHWLVSAGDLRRNLVAVLLDEPRWQVWLGRATGSGARAGEPAEPRAGSDRAFSAASRWLTVRPSDADAVAGAALRFAQWLEREGHGEEAIHWYRQSAMIRQSEACPALIRLLHRFGDDDEARYWTRRGNGRASTDFPTADQLDHMLARGPWSRYGQQVPDLIARPDGADLRRAAARRTPATATRLS